MKQKEIERESVKREVQPGATEKDPDLQKLNNIEREIAELQDKVKGFRAKWEAQIHAVLCAVKYLPFIIDCQ